MKNKKLSHRAEFVILIITLISILTAVLPITSAQIPQIPQVLRGVSGIPYYFVLINAAVIALVLFALQAFLIPQKEGKERTAVWLAILAGSVIIAFNWGRQGFIWDVGPFAQFIKIKVIVNSLILTGVGYFLLGFWKVAKPESPEGNAAYSVMIFLVAFLIASQLGNKWLWDEAIFKELKDYLFSKEPLKEGILVLKDSQGQNRLLIFLIGAALFAFFFNSFLLKGGVGENKAVGTFLAILIAAAMAKSGSGFRLVSTLGEMIFLVMVHSSMKGAGFDPGGLGTLLALTFSMLIVGISSAVITANTPQYRGLLAEKIGCNEYQWALWKFTIGQLIPIKINCIPMTQISGYPTPGAPGAPAVGGVPGAPGARPPPAAQAPGRQIVRTPYIPILPEFVVGFFTDAILTIIFGGIVIFGGAYVIRLFMRRGTP